jgi:hypothetical protein
MFSSGGHQLAAAAARVFKLTMVLTGGTVRHRTIPLFPEAISSIFKEFQRLSATCE